MVWNKIIEGLPDYFRPVKVLTNRGGLYYGYLVPSQTLMFKIVGEKGIVKGKVVKWRI